MYDFMVMYCTDLPSSRGDDCVVLLETPDLPVSDMCRQVDNKAEAWEVRGHQHLHDMVHTLFFLLFELLAK